MAFHHVKTTTLFGTVAKVKNLVWPSNNYEKFVERYFQGNIHTNKAKSVERDAQIFVYYSCVTLREGGGGSRLSVTMTLSVGKFSL